tara:strand:+ start:53 stop:280 length:228 start_codon:yes stop_codon:yes gene_type:complete
MSSKKKKRSLVSKALNNRATRLFNWIAMGDLMGSPPESIEMMGKLLGMQEGGQIKVKRKSSKKKPRGWGAARFGK